VFSRREHGSRSANCGSQAASAPAHWKTARQDSIGYDVNQRPLVLGGGEGEHGFLID
jgi:hypothetical protein